MTLLVVDDDSVIRMLMRTLLTAQGHAVITASDGEDALLKLAQANVDMIITDVYMPRIDGIRLRNIVRETKGKERTPVIFISGYRDQLTLSAARDAELEGFFRKGRPLTELLAWINYLGQAPDKRPPYPPDNGPSSDSQRHFDQDPRRTSPRPAI